MSCTLVTTCLHLRPHKLELLLDIYCIDHTTFWGIATGINPFFSFLFIFIFQVTAVKAFNVDLLFLLIIRDILIHFWLLPGVMAVKRKIKKKKATATKMSR